MDFVLDFSQANIKFYMYMEIPQGIKIKGGSRTTHIFNLLKNLYRQKQGYRVYNQHLTKWLEEILFWNSRVGGCMFYWNEVIFIVYMDNSIFSSTSDAAMDQAITNIGAKFDI